MTQRDQPPLAGKGRGVPSPPTSTAETFLSTWLFGIFLIKWIFFFQIFVTEKIIQFKDPFSPPLTCHFYPFPVEYLLWIRCPNTICL